MLIKEQFAKYKCIRLKVFRRIRLGKHGVLLKVTKNKLYHRYFDNKLQKIFRTNILENDTRQILLVVALMVNLYLKLQMEKVD